MSKMDIPIDAKVLFEMYQYAAYVNHHFQSEIAGWGHYHKDKGIYKLAPLLKQIASGAEVDTFPDSIINDIKYNIKDMIVQWHSHVNMSTSPSQTDIKTIKDALKLFPALISIIVNCRNEYTARIDFSKAGASNNIELPEPITLDVNLIPYYDSPKVDKEVQEKLTKPKPIIIQQDNRYHHYYQPERYGRTTRWDKKSQTFIEINSENSSEKSPSQLLEERIRSYDLFNNDFVPPNLNEIKDEDDFTFDEKGYINMYNKFLHLSKTYANIFYTSSGSQHILINQLNGNSISFDMFGMEYNGFEGDKELLNDFLRDAKLPSEIEKVTE